MKHAAILYTCIGLMGAAAVTGFVDYSRAKKAGVFSDLYTEHKTDARAPFIKKEINVDDYSRGPLEEVSVEQEQQSKVVYNPASRKPKKPKPVTGPPPPPRVIIAPPPPTVPNKKVAPGNIEPPPVMQEDRVIDSNVTEEITAPVTPPLPEVKEVSFKSFSRAPLENKKIAGKRKQRQ
jgi:hypothetical protein